VKSPVLRDGEPRPCVTDRPVSRILSRTTIPLGVALLRRSSDLPGTFIRRDGCPFGAAAPGRRVPALLRTRSLFGLAPCGVYPASAVTAGAVRFYRTFSPLPSIPCGNDPCGPPSKTGAVYFLWHSPSLSLNAQVPDVIRHTALRSPDFPLSPCLRLAAAAVQSACWSILPRIPEGRRDSRARTVAFTDPAWARRARARRARGRRVRGRPGTRLRNTPGA
jgi:hypothetical protein